jgi:hypothetical protein
MTLNQGTQRFAISWSRARVVRITTTCVRVRQVRRAVVRMDGVVVQVCQFFSTLVSIAANILQMVAVAILSEYFWLIKNGLKPILL